MASPIQVFISHSARDADAAAALIRLIQPALGLPASAIRCTSVDGYRLPAGVDTNSRLRQEVNEAVTLLGIISEMSLRSLYVVFELGARWGTAKPFVPLLAPGTPEAILSGPLAGINALRLDREQQVQQLLSDLARHLGRPLEQAASYQQEMTAFSATMGELQRASIEASLQAMRASTIGSKDAHAIDLQPGILTIPVGLATHYFATDSDGELCVFEDCLVLVCASEIVSMMELLPLLEGVAHAGRPLFIVARKVTGEALATLIMNTQRGSVRACVANTERSPVRAQIERVVARETGAVVFHDEAWVQLQRGTLAQLGRAKRIESRDGSTTFTTT